MSIYDVARVAGVSKTVVSLVINGKADKYKIAKATQCPFELGVNELASAKGQGSTEEQREIVRRNCFSFVAKLV